MPILVPITNGRMTRFHKHFFVYLSILARAHPYTIEINGEVTFDMRISDLLVPFVRAIDDYDLKKIMDKDEIKKMGEEKKKMVDDDDMKTIEKEKVKDDQRDMKGSDSKETSEGLKEIILSSDQGNRNGVTAAPMVECLYQYPDAEQVNAMLSNMMNELTRVFVRVNKMMRRMNARRAQKTRFKVIERNDKRFFEDVYNNMTKEYSKLYNTTADHTARAANDPCQNQEELKEVWRVLLESSLNSLRRACQSCIEEFLRSQDSSDNYKIKYKLGQFLVKELDRIRSSQLDMLCDSFQLCYDELL